MSEKWFSSSTPGHFYAVGIGPGSADMITIRARNIIESADVILAPRSRLSETSMALDTVKPFIGCQRIEECVYPMSRDVKATGEFWSNVANEVVSWCAEGLSVVQITVGDPLIFSTSCYLLNALEGRMPFDTIHVVSGVSAFQAASAIFQEALTIQEDRLMLMPATDLARVAEALDRCETLVLYKAGQRIDALCALLEQKGYGESARLVCYAEDSTRQYTTRTLRNAVGGKHGYMSTVIVHLKRAGWNDVVVSDDSEIVECI